MVQANWARRRAIRGAKRDRTEHGGIQAAGCHIVHPIAPVEHQLPCVIDRNRVPHLQLGAAFRDLGTFRGFPARVSGGRGWGILRWQVTGGDRQDWSARRLRDGLGGDRRGERAVQRTVDGCDASSGAWTCADGCIANQAAPISGPNTQATHKMVLLFPSFLPLLVPLRAAAAAAFAFFEAIAPAVTTR